jgi:hypothetical protein
MLFPSSPADVVELRIIAETLDNSVARESEAYLSRREEPLFKRPASDGDHHSCAPRTSLRLCNHFTPIFMKKVSISCHSCSITQVRHGWDIVNRDGNAYMRVTEVQRSMS